MYIGESLIEGLNILGFDRETIKKVARERSLEEIFLSVLFLNYLFVLLLYLIGLLLGGFSVSGREVNMPVLFGLLMIYPFSFNVLVYGIYGFFGLMAELLDKRKHIKPLISVGFHTAVVYSFLFFVIALLSTLDLAYGALLFGVFLLYFVYTMFVAISEVYNFSLSHTLIVLFTPFLLIGIGILLLMLLFPGLVRDVVGYLFA